MKLQALLDAMDITTPLPSLPEPAERQALREQNGVTVVEASAVVGVSDNTYRYWEAGTRTPRTKGLLLYRTLLGAFAEKVASR